MSYIKLLQIMLKKEKIHYKRMYQLFNAVEGFGGKCIAFPIIFFIITFFHYCFAFMHFGFETFLYICNRQQYNYNINNLLIKVNKWQ